MDRVTVRPVVGVLAVIALLAGCGPVESSSGGQVVPAGALSDAEAEAKARWEQADVTDYTYAFYTGCGERATGRFQVTVRGGEVTEVEGLDDPGRNLVEHLDLSDLVNIMLTVDGLWAEVERARSDADRVEVRADERYGYPARVDIDWQANAIDDEVCYEISDLVPG